MADHKTRIEPNGGWFDARCSCRKIAKVSTVEEGEAWVKAHLELVDRVREHLANRTPPLQSQRDYYLDKAHDQNETPENQKIWKQLADELTVRLGEVGASSEAPPRLW